MRRSWLTAVRIGVVALVAAAATLVVAAPAYAASTWVNITCYDHTWPARNEIAWTGSGLSYPKNGRFQVYRTTYKNGTAINSSNFIVYSNSAGSWDTGTTNLLLGRTEGGEFRVYYAVYNTSNGAYMGAATDACTIS